VKVLRVIAWGGLVVTALGFPLSFSSSSTLAATGSLGAGVGFWLAWVLGIAGTLMTLIGGFISKPQHLWIGAIVIGIVYISSFYGIIPWWVETNKLVVGIGVNFSPGLAYIIGGIVMQRLSHKGKV